MRSLVALAAVAIACQKPPAPIASEAAAPVSSSSSSCASTVASYDALVAAGGACASDADCLCFNGGVSQKTPCGGVTDKASAAKLDKLVGDYESGHCDSLMCAAQICTPSCNAGKCVNAPPAAITWTSCANDAECTYVSLGCCDTTPVNRAHVADAKRKLERSGHPYCPPKSACGPSSDGTWAGAPGKCTAGNCVLR
jgi:hypothetical protein